MSKLFSLVGVARVRENAPLKLKVANGKLAWRVAKLVRAQMVDVELFELPEAVSKEQALAWLRAEHPALAAELKGKPANVSKPNAVKDAKPEVAVVDVELSAAAKLALKRMKDAARKREKRAAEKAAKLAAAA